LLLLQQHNFKRFNLDRNGKQSFGLGFASSLDGCSLLCSSIPFGSVFPRVTHIHRLFFIGCFHVCHFGVIGCGRLWILEFSIIFVAVAAKFFGIRLIGFGFDDLTNLGCNVIAPDLNFEKSTKK
jgi:hypothetical protein